MKKNKEVLTVITIKNKYYKMFLNYQILIKKHKKNFKIVNENEIINLMSVCFAVEKSLKTKKWEKVEYIN